MSVYEFQDSEHAREFETIAFGFIDDSNMILSQEVTSLVSLVLIMILFFWTFLSFQHESALQSSCLMKFFCLLSVISFLIMAFIASMLINNFITQQMTLSMCKVVYPAFLLSYNSAKISIYYLISFRIESIFPTNIYRELSTPFIVNYVYRFVCFLVPTLLWILFIYLCYEDIQIMNVERKTGNYDYKYCFAKKFYRPHLAQFVLVAIAFVDCAFHFLNLYLFISKSFRITQLMRLRNVMTVKKKNFINKLSNLMKKTTTLVLISVSISTFFLVGSAFILQQLIFFLVLDGLSCVITIICFFQFGDRLYELSCGKFEKCCFCVYCLDKNLRKNTASKHKKKMDYTLMVDPIDNAHNDKYSAPIKPTIPRAVVRFNDDNVKKHSTLAGTANTTSSQRSDRLSRLKMSNTTTNTGMFHTNAYAQDDSRKGTLTALSGFDHMDVGDIEITEERRIKSREDHSLLSVSEFL